MLTIGELARLAGTTVRAVRHYHAVGLLPEPARDRSGYRIYGADALVRLLRVRRMRDIGLPLDRIGVLLAAAEPDVHDALVALDADLAARAERIAVQRARLAELRASSSDPELPEPLGRIFAQAAADGVPSRALRQEKEALLLDLALHPDRAAAIAAEYEDLYTRLRSRPQYHELTARLGALADAVPDAPEVEDVAQALVDLVRSETEAAVGGGGDVAPEAERVFRDWVDALPPAQRRLLNRIVELAAGSDDDRHDIAPPVSSAPVTPTTGHVENP